ncbi:MAG TPA: transketolase C-terminal domain-containing protein [bacterium]|nr:transketolase C-terminal domain-containing protein [bacterium]HNS34150.1 transketolase C-terminal domain-containing protein [bacterium]HNZ73132.1 transketolase C-terminal domain-containing protein [bacterium]HOH67275.1 transketolase C-terminal domain-containing protein [bacterium]HQA63935.1 transketolase C-terminal domain-containing protein [bacterium]
MKILEGSRAIAETINNIGPEVVSAYPITPQTHIVEDLAKLKADGLADYEYVRAESEFAAISIVEGAAAMGVRTYTATSSQGLLLMTEVLFNVAGMRLPMVLTCANRAVSAPINIWNDQQDAVTMRDSGWLMWFGEDNQEVCDLHILAYKVAEKLALPVMVNLDGFVLTHVVEPVEIESPAKIKKFLPRYKPQAVLDVKKPLTFGAFATPAHYFEIRQELHDDIVSSQKVIKSEMKKFKEIFGRQLGLIEYYGDKNAEIVIVAMGSVIGTIKDVADKLKKFGKKIGVLKVVSLRPFPDEEIIKALIKAKNIAVIDKSVSLGTEGILATEIRRALYGDKKKVVSYVMGLGGRDITEKMIEGIYSGIKKENKKVVLAGK